MCVCRCVADHDVLLANAASGFHSLPDHNSAHKLNVQRWLDCHQNASVCSSSSLRAFLEAELSDFSPSKKAWKVSKYGSMDVGKSCDELSAPLSSSS
eukprot:m.395183 g.395183  ORF g.395183 m.395183 type:complete len:97 (+) comp56388_c0_seq1:910-1200(+)